MARKKKPTVRHRVGAIAGYMLVRETTEEGYGGQTQLRTSFIGIVFDKDEAENMAKVLNG